MNRTISFFLAGAVLGSAAAALAMPISGRRLRREVRRKVEAASDRATDASRTLMDAGKQTVRTVGRAFQRSPLNAVAR